MDILHVTLLGRFEATWEAQPLEGFAHAKARELFCFLLLNRDKPNSRESVASLLWGDHYTTEVSKKYLRKALWQLNESLSGCSEEIRNGLIVADTNWIELKSVDSLWLDVAIVDQAYAAVKGVPGSGFNPRTASVLSHVVDLYRGELLEGEFQEWSFYDLARYRKITLILLDKLMDYSMARGEYETTLEYGEQVLRYDPAREFTHLKLMRAYYGLGDRTGAIRQFNRCRQILRDELDIEPSNEAITLYEKVRADEVVEMSLISGADQEGVDQEALQTCAAGLRLVDPPPTSPKRGPQPLNKLAADG